ncbi:glycosyltransferase [Massilia sp. TS11]|uniref:glycosyltransferase family 2 protein n=1 Tax=Massilia sp. TS11 TaxID=2908003 RepID=UPI001EDACCA6|nr:glycosyltransferase family 2 protein [Massilia sp. TS11]MCG2582842.1 glycosyltransferase family 2 protein [Massilia sp. TS11]
MNSRKSSKTQRQRWQGRIEGEHRGLVYGWAIDASQPDARVVVEICLDGTALCTATADVLRSDLAPHWPELPDHCHGFVADIGLLRPGQRAVLTARVANTDSTLEGAVELHADVKPPLAATSMVFHDGGLRLHGWAVDSLRPQLQLRIRALDKQTVLAETVANLDHPTTREHHSGPHSFVLDLPLSLADGQEHVIHVVDGEGRAVNGSPLTVCAHAAGARALLSEAATPALRALASSYERFLPRSLGWQHYRAWCASFEADAPAAGKHRLAVVLAETGADADARAASAASVAALPGATLFANARQDFSARLRAARASKAELILCLRAGDCLRPHSAASFDAAFADPEVQVAYCDSEDSAGPWFKPAWDRDYALASDYPLDGLCLRASLLDPKALPADAASLAWQALLAAGTAVAHVPRVLYQRLQALAADEQAARLAAAQAALKQIDKQAHLLPRADAPAAYASRRLQRKPARATQGKTVSIIIPTRDRADLLRTCLDSVRAHTAWPALEIIVVDNGSSEAATKALFRQEAKRGTRILSAPGPFNFSRLNNLAVDAASGDFIVLMNNDIEALHPGWLEEMLSQLGPDTGAVGAKLLWPNDMVQHGGVVLGMGNAAAHFGNCLSDADEGDHGRNQVVQQLSAVTAACLLMRKRDYLAVGGLDEQAFPVAFNDVDLCLKLRARGQTIVWTPFARLRHAESASRGREDDPAKRARATRELQQLRTRWGHVLLQDPAYHPSLNLDSHSQAFGGLALPPRARHPRRPGLPSSTSEA